MIAVCYRPGPEATPSHLFQMLATGGRRMGDARQRLLHALKFARAGDFEELAAASGLDPAVVQTTLNNMRRSRVVERHALRQSPVGGRRPRVVYALAHAGPPDEPAGLRLGRALQEWR